MNLDLSSGSQEEPTGLFTFRSSVETQKLSSRNGRGSRDFPMKCFSRSSTPFPLVFCLTSSPFPPVSMSLGLSRVLAADVAGVGAWSSQTLWSGSPSGPSPWEEGEVPVKAGVRRPPPSLQVWPGDRAALLQAVAHGHLLLSLCVARETESWRDCHQVSDELIIIFLISCLKSASRNGCFYVHSSHIDLWCCVRG